MNHSHIIWQVCDTNPFAYLTLSVRILSFDGLKSPLLKKCLSDLNLYKAIKSQGSVVQLKLKCLLMKPTHDDIIEAKDIKRK